MPDAHKYRAWLTRSRTISSAKTPCFCVSFLVNTTAMYQLDPSAYRHLPVFSFSTKEKIFVNQVLDWIYHVSYAHLRLAMSEEALKKLVRSHQERRDSPPVYISRKAFEKPK